MAFRVFVDGEVLTAALVNDYLMEQAVITCTSGTRPTAQEGMAIWETDTDKLLIYNGVSWQPPWNLPWGKQAYATTAANHSGIGSTFTEVHSGSWRATCTVTKNRLYRITIEGSLTHTSIEAPVEIAINDLTSNLVSPIVWSDNPLASQRFHLSYMYAASSTGSLTVRLMMREVSGGAGTAIFVSDEQSYILIEDIGSFGAPAA